MLLFATLHVHAQPIADPLEPFNRVMHGFNMGLERVVVRPVAVVYETVVPNGGRRTIGNFLRNLRTPLSVLNFMLQGNFRAAGDQSTRFFVNSTIGLLGLFEIADHNGKGIAYKKTDFGASLASWGTGEGAYLVLPIFGPSTVRDGTGKGIDFFVDPVDYAARDVNNWDLARTATKSVHQSPVIHDTLVRAREAMVGDDFYLLLRSLYMQRRRAELGQVSDHDLFDEDY